MSSTPAGPSPDSDTPIYDDLVRAIPVLGDVGDRSDMPSDITEAVGQHRR